MEKFEKLTKLGQGTYGIVYKAMDKQTGKIVALKRIRCEKEDQGVPCTAIREISLLKQLRQRNIVSLHDVVHTEKRLTLIFEYLDSDLRKYLDLHPQGLQPKELRSFLYQLLCAIAFCHENRVLHRDLKPQNLLVNKNGELKLADFGLARAFGLQTRNYSCEVVTIWYRAPDVIFGSNMYGRSIDLWSVGCVFAEMASSTALFKGKNSGDQLVQIYSLLGIPKGEDWLDLKSLPLWADLHRCHLLEDGSIPEHNCVNRTLDMVVPNLDKEGRKLLLAFLTYKPSLRLNAADALKDPWFDNTKSDIDDDVFARPES